MIQSSLNRFAFMSKGNLQFKRLVVFINVLFDSIFQSCAHWFVYRILNWILNHLLCVFIRFK